MKKSSIFKNYMYNLYYQIILIIASFITTPYLSRVLGTENIGIYSFTLSVTTYFILIGGLGINLYGQKEVAYVRDNEFEKNKTFWEIFLLKTFLLLIALGIFYVTFCIDNQYAMYYKILLLEIASNIIDITWFFQGLEQFKKILWRNSLIKIVGLFLTFALVRSQKDLYLYVFIYALTNLLGNLSLWVSIQKYIKFIKWNELRIFRHLKYVIGLFIPQIAVQIYTVLDKTMLGNLVSDISQVGYYEYGQKIVQMALLVLTSIGTVMLPRVSNLYKRGRKNEIKSLLNKVFKIVFLLSLPLIIGLIAIAPEFVVLFLGKDYKESIQIINWMSPILLFSGLSNVIGRQFFLPTQKNKEYTVSVVVGACSNVIFNFIFIPKFYAKGAALATSLSELLILLVQLYFSRRDFNYKNIFKGIYKYAIATMIMCFVLIGMSKIHISLFIDLVIKITTGTLIYFASLIIMKEEYTCGFLTKIRRSNK